MSDTLKISLHEIIEEPISGTRPKGGVNFDGEIPSFGGENVTMEGGLTYYPVKKVSLDFFNQMNRGQLQELDVLINKDGANTGKSTIYRKSPYNRACINEHLFILRGKPSQLDQVYFHYLLQSSEIKQGIERKITGSAQPGLNSQFCRNFPLEIVPLPEQKKIASILTSVDEVIENTQKQIDKLQDLKKATMNELLTKGIGHTEFKDSELGRIPKSWEVTKLGKVTERFYQGINTVADKVVYHSTGIPILQTKHITSGEITFAAIKYLDKATYLRYKDKFQPRHNDILLSNIGTIGKSVLVQKPSEYLIAWNIFLISVTSELEPRFAHLHLQKLDIENYYENLMTGNATKFVNKSNLSDILLTLPPIAEQVEISNILDAIVSKIELQKQKLSQTQSLKKSLMQDLLTGKVRVTVN